MKVFRVLFILLISLHITRSDSSESIEEHVFTYMSEHNDIQIKSVVVVSNEKDCLNIDFWKSTFLQNKLVTYLPMDVKIDELQKCLSNNEPNLVIVVESFLKVFENLLRSMPKSYFADNSWLLVLDSNSESTNLTTLMLERLEPTNQLALNSQIYLLKRSSNVSELFELYQSCTEQMPTIRNLVTFSNKSFHVFNDQFIWIRRKDLTECKIRMAYAAESLFYKKYEKPYFKMLLNQLNFSVKYLLDEDKSYGVLDPDTGKWKGVVGMLQRNEADVSLNWMAITSERANVISYSIPILTVTNKLFMKKPGSAPYWGTFLYVFYHSYWLSLISIIVVFFSCIYCVSYLTLENLPRGTFWSIYRIKYAVFTTCRAMALLDVDIEINEENMKLKSWKLMIFVICFFGMVNCFIYNGGLTAFLMAQTFDTPIQELEDFHLNPDYQLLVRKGGSAEQYFRETPKLIWL